MATPPDSAHRVNGFARHTMVAAWILAAIILFLPAYHGEVVAPGAVLTLVTIQMIGLLLLEGAAGKPLLLLAVGWPLVLFLLTPAAQARWCTDATILAAWAAALALGTVLAAVTFIHEWQGDFLVGMYAAPLPLLLAAASLGAFSYAGAGKHSRH